MKCRDFEKALATLKIGEAPTASMREHVDGCNSCLLLLKKQEAFYSGLNFEKQLQVSPFTSTRVVAALETSINETYIPLFKPVKLFAFTIAFIVGLSVAWVGSLNQASTVGRDIVSDYFSENSPGLSIEQAWLNYEDYE